MKTRITLFFMLLVLSFGPMASHAGNSITVGSDVEIVVTKSGESGLNPNKRSLSAQAKAWIDNSSTLLTVQVLYAQGGVDVILTNARGQIVHQDSAVADGSKQRLMLPVLDAGTYYLTISCNGTEWDGELNL